MLPLEENPHPLVFKAAKAGVPLSGPASSEDRNFTYAPAQSDWRLSDDAAYVQKVYDQVEAQIQAGMDRLAAKRTLPVLG